MPIIYVNRMHMAMNFLMVLLQLPINYLIFFQQLHILLYVKFTLKKMTSGHGLWETNIEERSRDFECEYDYLLYG